MNQNSKLFLLDAYALIYRAYYAFIKNPRINSKGFNTSAILGFVNTLEEVLKKENPTHIGVAFDPPGPTFRHEAFEQYKAQREETPEAIRLSVPIIKDIIKAYRIPILEVAGYEADDVIGTLATEAGNQGITTYMMTPDKDYGQLVTDHVFMYRPKYGDKEFEVMGVEQVKAKFDIQSPAQVIDMLGLMGDSSDNIPGCPGVGEKTAQKLIAEFGSIENLLEHTDQLKGALKTKVETNREMIIFSKFLATIKVDVPIRLDMNSLVREQADEDTLRKIFEELEFRTLMERIFKKESSPASPIACFPYFLLAPSAFPCPPLVPTFGAPLNSFSATHLTSFTSSLPSFSSSQFLHPSSPRPSFFPHSLPSSHSLHFAPAEPPFPAPLAPPWFFSCLFRLSRTSLHLYLPFLPPVRGTPPLLLSFSPFFPPRSLHSLSDPYQLLPCSSVHNPSCLYVATFPSSSRLSSHSCRSATLTPSSPMASLALPSSLPSHPYLLPRSLCSPRPGPPHLLYLSPSTAFSLIPPSLFRPFRLPLPHLLAPLHLPPPSAAPFFSSLSLPSFPFSCHSRSSHCLSFFRSCVSVPHSFVPFPLLLLPQYRHRHFSSLRSLFPLFPLPPLSVSLYFFAPFPLVVYTLPPHHTFHSYPLLLFIFFVCEISTILSVRFWNTGDLRNY
ncbi:5'-3' exonuclease, N-terminal resolvase-like domain [Bacteroides fragilis CL03T12C07]|nr:5'-3' exonuclease, N-terminal resolvase-like domain [Bacteroides fragilis CL03T12C07]